MSGVKRILRALRLDKIAAVDYPCQEGASADILKRAAPGEHTPSDMALVFCDAVRKAGIPVEPDIEKAAGEQFAEILKSDPIDAGFWKTYCDGASALNESLITIMKDGSIDRPAMIAKSIKEFAGYVQEIMPGDIGKSLAAGFAEMAGDGSPIEKDNSMSAALKKSLGLPDTATEADMLKAIADQQAALSKSNEDLEKAKKMPAELVAAMDDKDSDTVKKALATGEAFRTTDGVLVMKSVAGPMFDVMKSQNAQLVKVADELAKARDETEETAFTKRAADLGFPEGTGSIMRKAYSGDPTAIIEFEKRLAAQQEQIASGELFKSFGGQNGFETGESSAADEMQKKADEVAKGNPNLSKQQAYTQAYGSPANAEIKKRMKDEGTA